MAEDDMVRYHHQLNGYEFEQTLGDNGSFPSGSDSKESACNVGDWGSIPGEANGNPLQYSCLENLIDGGGRSATVHGVAKSQTRLSNVTILLYFKGG